MEPLTGERYFDCFDTLNAEHFGQFIHQFSARYSDSVIVMQVDQAGAHLADELDWPENIIPIAQPAYCPELNSIERLWQHLKSQIKWEFFPHLKALLQRVQDLIDGLSNTLVRSITGWDFIVDAVLSAPLQRLGISQRILCCLPNTLDNSGPYVSMLAGVYVK